MKKKALGHVSPAFPAAVKTKTAVARRLRAARALLERKRWSQGELGRLANGRASTRSDLRRCAALCAVGAIYATETTSVPGYVMRRIFAEANKLGRRGGDGDHIPEWNDAPERTKKQVLAAFDKAVRFAETREP